MRKFAILAVLSICAAARVAGADIQKLLHETQQMSQEGNLTSMVWWMPTAFWEESLRQDPQMTPEMQREFLAVLDDYTVFAVIHARTGAFGGLMPASRNDLMENQELITPAGAGHLLAPAELNRDAANFFSMMKPMMAGMLGQFGEGMEFFVYSNLKDGAKIIDPLKSGEFEFRLFKKSFKWRLPLGALLPAKFDPDTGEQFPGNYSFSPFTGQKLVVKEAAKP